MTIDERALAAALAAAKRIESVQAEVDRARQEFQRAVRAVYLEGGSMREIAEALGISHQRVHQLLDLPRPGDGSPRGRRGTRKDVLTCSFCRRKQSKVRKLIAGNRIFICDGCTATGLAVLDPAGESPFVETAHVRMWRSADTSRCAFCGKDNDVLRPDDAESVPLVTAGVDGAICRECLDLCQEIVDEETGDPGISSG